MPARGGEQDVAVGQVDRVEVVEDAVCKLHQAGAVGMDFVEMKCLFIVRLVAENDFRAVGGEIRPPKRTVQRWLRHELPNLAVRGQPVEDHDLSARHGHIAQAVAGLVRPLGALRIGHIHEQHLVEVEHGVLQHHDPLHRADLEVKVLVFGFPRGGLFLQRGEPGKLRGKIDPGRHSGVDPLRRIRRVQAISSWIRCGVGWPSAWCSQSRRRASRPSAALRVRVGGVDGSI